MKKIALIGECMIELNGKPFGNMWQSYGGDTLNTATYLSRISKKEDVSIHYVSALGTDKLSYEMLTHWQNDGINTDCVLLDSKHQPGLYLIQLDEKGERTFLYWRNDSAARYLLSNPNFSDIVNQLKKMDMIYLSGISLAILPKNDRTLLIKILENLHQKGIEIVFDSNSRPKLWENLQEAQEYYRQLLPLVDLALVTLDDEKALWNDANEEETLHRLKQIGIPKVILKCGQNGAIFYDKDQRKTAQVATQIINNVIDTTSAGDSFNAGFLQGYLTGKSLEICCQQGNKLAGIVIQHKGAIIDKTATSYLKSEFN